MKNSCEGSRKAPGSFMRVTAATLMVTVVCTVVGAGLALAADAARTSPGTADGHALITGILADHALTAEIVLVLASAALMLAYRHHRRSGNRRRSAHGRTRRPPAHDRASSGTRISAFPAAGDRTPGPRRPAAVGNPSMSSPRRPAAGQALHADDYPSWPGRPGPYALHPDHPSWPGRPDPRWAGTEAALRVDGDPSWPEPPFLPWRDAQPSADNGGPGGPGRGGPAAWRQLPSTADRPPAADGSLPAGMIDRVRPEADWDQPERVQVWDAGSVELATWIISEANQQAADIRHEARDQVAVSLADARQEAAELVRRASEQATTTLTTAEQEAAEIRATVTKLSAELGGVAAQVTQNLVSFGPPTANPLTRPAGQPVTGPAPEPVTEPEARPVALPVARPGTKPETRPKSRPGAKPGTRPAAKPGTRPAAKPNGAPRQLVAARAAAVAAAALVLFALVCGVTEVALHGLPFFVFRSVGTGETGPNGLQEDQGPGQPDAPKPAASHVRVQPSAHTAVTVPNGL